MDWWKELWLNESFATFIGYLAVDNLLPEYNIWQQFITNAFTGALDLDALHNSHPIEVLVYHPSEIDEIFDQILIIIISYLKVSCNNLVVVILKFINFNKI